MSGLVKAKKFDIEDSNIALLGSQLEKDVKLAAAQTEEAWTNAGQKVGIEIWRIEKFNVVSWPKEQYGKFYSGDSYIILNTYVKDPATNPDKLAWDVHFWIGEESSQDEYGTAAYKTVELDDVLGGEPVQHREVQGHECDLFQTYFKKLEFLSGGIDSGFNHVEPEKFEPRLLHLKGKKKILVRQVPMTTESLNSGDVFVLDNGRDIYQMNGKNAGPMEKAKAAELTRGLDDERKGLPQVHVFEEEDTGDSNATAFWDKLGGKKEIKTAEEGGSDAEAQQSAKRLFKLSDASGTMEFTEVAEVKKSSLDSNDVFVYDASFEIFVWVGKDASKAEKAKGLGYATDYLFKYNRPKTLPICRILEGGENETFAAALDD